jgi:hypothetical protein
MAESITEGTLKSFEKGMFDAASWLSPRRMKYFTSALNCHEY